MRPHNGYGAPDLLEMIETINRHDLACLMHRFRWFCISRAQTCVNSKSMVERDRHDAGIINTQLLLDGIVSSLPTTIITIDNSKGFMLMCSNDKFQHYFPEFDARQATVRNPKAHKRLDLH